MAASDTFRTPCAIIIRFFFAVKLISQYWEEKNTYFHFHRADREKEPTLQKTWLHGSQAENWSKHINVM